MAASPDASLEATNKASLQVVKAVTSFPEAKFMWSLTANWGGFGGMVAKNWKERKRTTEQMYGQLYYAVSQVPGLQVFPRLDPPLPTPGQYDVELILASDVPPDQMLQTVGAVLGAGWQSGKFLYVDTDLKIDLPEARVVIDRDQVADLGLDLASVGRELGTLLGGAYVNRFNYYDRSYKVIPQIGNDRRTTVGPLLDLKIKTPSGRLVPVSTFTHIESSTAPRTLNRFQQRNAVRIFGGVKPGVTKEEGLRVLENAAAAAAGPGVGLDYAGESRQIRLEGAALTVTLGFAVILIYLVLAAQFRSFRDPLIVLVGSVPLAISGALVFSYLDFTTINIYSQVGLITLVGLIAKNGILIVQFANTLQSQGELHDQDAVFRYQSHQRDQPDLGVDVDGGEIEVAEHQRPGNRERHRAYQHDQRVPEAPELRREHQIDQDHGESEGHGERRAFESDLPRFAGVVEPDAGARHRLSGVLQHAQSFLFGDAGLHASEDPHRVALLKSIQRARRGARLDVREGRHRHETTAGRLDLEIEQRRDRGAALVADLGNDLVAAVVIVEPVDVRAAQQRAELSAHAGEVEPQVGHLVAIDHDSRLGQIDLQVSVDVQELAALPAGTQHGAHRLQHLVRGHVAGQNQLHVILAGRRQRGVEAGEHLQARHLRHRVVQLAVHLLGGAFAFLPILRDHPAKPAPVGRQRPHKLGFGKRRDSLDHLERRLVGRLERRVGRGRHEQADVALVLDGRQLPPRVLIQRHRRQHDQHRGRDDRPAHLQGAIQQPLIAPAHRFEGVVHQLGQPPLPPRFVDEARAHHRGQRHRHETGNYDGGGEGDRELQEQGAGEPALEPDRRVYRRERDRHRDDGAYQLARAHDRRLDPRLALAHVPLDVFDHDDGIVHHQSHRQHDREDGEEVQAEAEGVHDDRGAYQRHRHCHQRHQCGPDRPHEQEDHEADDQDRLDQGLRDLLQRVGHEHRRVVSHLHVDIAGQRGPDPGHFSVEPVGHFDLVATRQRPDAHVHGFFVAEFGDEVGFLRPQLDAGDVGQSHDRPVALGHDQVLELLGRAQIGVGKQVDLHQVALGLPHGGEVVVALQRRVHVAGREIERGQPVGVDPDPHGDGPPTEHVHALHAGQRRELGLHVAGEPVGERRNLARRGREAQVERRIRPVGPLHLHHRWLGLGGQLGAHLLQPRGDLCQRRRTVVVQLQVHCDGADAGAAGGFHVVHAADGRHDALDRRREKAADGFGARAVVHRRDQHRRALYVRILLHRQRRDRPPPHEHDHEVDYDREDRMPDERIGKRAHERFSD